MSGMFKDAYAANPNTSNRDTSSVTNMGEMFRDATSADPDMSGWNFSSIANMFGMFNGILISTTNYNNLLTPLQGLESFWMQARLNLQVEELQLQLQLQREQT